jgi:hypothetical protein
MRCAVPRRIPAPRPDKIPVALADIPQWVYGFPEENAPEPPPPYAGTDAWIEWQDAVRAAYIEWQQAVADWDATHDIGTIDELLADPVAMVPAPWDPKVDPP